MSQSYYPSSVSSQRNSQLAVFSLVAGILGLTFFPGLGSIVALILGYMAKKEIRENPETLTGKELATAGIILGWIGVVLAILAIGLILVAIGLVVLFMFPVSVSYSQYGSILLPLLQLCI